MLLKLSSTSSNDNYAFLTFTNEGLSKLGESSIDVTIEVTIDNLTFKKLPTMVSGEYYEIDIRPKSKIEEEKIRPTFKASTGEGSGGAGFFATGPNESISLYVGYGSGPALCFYTKGNAMPPLALSTSGIQVMDGETPVTLTTEDILALKKLVNVNAQPC